jgi:hypothetical protein
MNHFLFTTYSNIKYAIEARRFDKRWYWKIVIIVKDLLWVVIFKRLRSPIEYIFSNFGGWWYRKQFASVETFCMFVGYPRSGHSLIGSLLDAHPDIIIAHEQHALYLAKKRVGKHQLFYQLLKNSVLFASHGRIWNGYSYFVTSQWQGRFKHLRVIGDKHGAETVDTFLSQPASLSRLLKTISPLSLRLVHVVRNPFDVIATIARADRLPLWYAADYFFHLVDGVVLMQKDISEKSITHVYHERFIDDPKSELRQLCIFLNIEPSAQYLDDCAAIVWTSAHQTRYDADWDPGLVESIHQRISQYPFLSHYRYDI